MSCQDCNCGRKEQEEASNSIVIKNGQISYGTIESYAPVTFQTSPDSLYPEMVASSNDSEASEIISDLLKYITHPDDPPTTIHAVMIPAAESLRRQAEALDMKAKVITRAREYLKK